MEIRKIDITTIEYQKLISEIGSVFNSLEWLSSYVKDVVTYGIYDKGGKLIGCFNLAFDKKMGVRWIKTPPFSPTIGLAFKNPSSNSAKKNSFAKSIYKLLASFLSDFKGALCTICLGEEHKDMQPFIWANFKVIPNYTYHLSLKEKSESNLTQTFSPERRNDIKKAIKDGIVCKETTDMSFIKKMVEYTYDRKHKTLQVDALNNMLSRFGKDGKCYSLVSFMNDEPLAATFVGYDKKTAFYLLGGYNPNKKHQGAGALAVLKSIEKAIELGVDTFDFEGSMLPEVEKYFRGFGGDMVGYASINKAPIPLEIALKFIDRSRF